MTISYRMTAMDHFYFFSYLLGKTYSGKILLAFMLALPVLVYVERFYQSTPNSRWEHFLLVSFWGIMAASYVLISVSLLFTLMLVSVVAPKSTVAIDERFFYIKDFISLKSPWRHFSTLIDQPDYFYFIGWTRQVFVPKRAFNSSAEAYAFFDTALAYWREAKGIAPPPAPDTSGVWPPAPRAGDSQELGETAKR